MRRGLILILVLMLVAAGCDVVDEGSVGPGEGGETGGDPRYPNVPRIELTAEEQTRYDALITGLLGEDGISGQLGQFWPTAYSAMVIGSLYRQPAGVTAYEGAAQPSGCGPLSVENAWYCPEDETLYFDDNYMRTLYHHFGIAAPTILLAHEWGHHIQRVMGPPTTSIASELQADCMAGMYFAVAVQPAAGEPDLRSAGATLFLLGDKNYRATEWFNADVHGPPSWRTKAFLDGMLGDGSFCRDYDQWEERGTEQIAPYRWLPAPGIEISRGENDVIVAKRLQQTAFLRAHGSPGAMPAIDYLPTALESWFGGDVSVVGEPTPIFTGEGTGGIIGGTGAAQAYQYSDADGTAQRGIFFVHVSTTGDAAVVSVVEPGAPPSTSLADEAWNPLVNYLFVVAWGLCPPDGAGALCAALGGQ